MATMESREQRPRTVAEANEQLDSVRDDMFNLLTDVNNAGDTDGWGSHRVKDGLKKIKKMEGRIKELEEIRRQLRQQPTAQAS